MTDFHKGEYCWLKLTDSLICQEGFCSDCQIYQDWIEAKKKEEIRNSKAKLNQPFHIHI